MNDNYAQRHTQGSFMLPSPCPGVAAASGIPLAEPPAAEWNPGQGSVGALHPDRALRPARGAQGQSSLRWPFPLLSAPAAAAAAAAPAAASRVRNLPTCHR